MRKIRWLIFLAVLVTILFFVPDENLRDRIYCRIHTAFLDNKGFRPAETLQSDPLCLKKPKGEIYDCCLFFNEFELLKIRLEELYDQVDHFVIVESEETHRGSPKPLNFLAQQELFTKYLDKIIYVPIEKIKGSKSPHSWIRENYQRNQIMRGLISCKNEDIILISDIDEIPAGRDLPGLIDRLLRSEKPLLFCGHKTFRYFFNRWDRPNSPWAGTAIMTYGFLKNHFPQYTRRRKDWKEFPLVASGWHLTTMGGSQKVIEKYESVVLHAGDNEDYLKNLERIQREASGQILVQVDESFPRYIRENQKYYVENGFIDMP